MSSYNRRVTIQLGVETVSGSGVVVTAWEEFACVWAKVEPLQGREYWSGAQVITERVYVFKTQYSAGIGTIAPPRHRISYNDRTYDIQSVIDFEDRRKELHIRCVQRD
jgi:SPP1 family predicted phage head-tail adaptor